MSIDLTLLPAPDFLPAVSFEQLLAEMRADAIGRAPELEATLDLESEPVTKLLEVFAFREMLLRTFVNDQARSNLLAYATGSRLDHFGALLNAVRLDNENDQAFLKRIQGAFEGLSNAGPEGSYRDHALASDARVRDVGITSPAPGQVQIAVLSTEGDGTPDQTLLDIVNAALNDNYVRPLTDQVSVVAATPLAVDVSATLFTDGTPGLGNVAESAEAALTAHIENNLGIGRLIAFSGLSAALHVTGVRRVAFIAPEGDIQLTPIQVAIPGEVNLTLEVGE